MCHHNVEERIREQEKDDQAGQEKTTCKKEVGQAGNEKSGHEEEAETRRQEIGRPQDRQTGREKEETGGEKESENCQSLPQAGCEEDQAQADISLQARSRRRDRGRDAK